MTKKTRHIHKARPSLSEDRGWVFCVTPHECAGKPSRQAAHGNITRQEMCRCGATRLVEINGGMLNVGPWAWENK